MSLPSFRSPLERTAWVQAQLKIKGSSFSEIARQHGWHPNAVSGAMQRASDPQEQAIAAALGVSQVALFPERYDATGRRLHRVLPNRRVARTGKESAVA